MSENKRRFTRIKIKRPVVLSISGGSTFRSNEIEDLSVGGCLVPVVARLRAGTACKVEILLGKEEGSKIITVEAIITRYHENTAAVRFESIDPDSLFLLQNLIRYNSEVPETIDEEITNRPGIV